MWQFYALTMTQWPLAASSPSTPGTPNNTFPGVGATSASANTTLETFDQGRIQMGCMNCHNTTRIATDFLWSLKDHAFPSNVPNLLMADPQFREMQTLLRTFPQTSAAAAQQKTIELRQKAVKPKQTTPHPE